MTPLDIANMEGQQALNGESKYIREADVALLWHSSLAGSSSDPQDLLTLRLKCPWRTFSMLSARKRSHTLSGGWVAWVCAFLHEVVR